MASHPPGKICAFIPEGCSAFGNSIIWFLTVTFDIIAFTQYSAQSSHSKWSGAGLSITMNNVCCWWVSTAFGQVTPPGSQMPVRVPPGLGRVFILGTGPNAGACFWLLLSVFTSPQTLLFSFVFYLFVSRTG